jgi:hypothetical protein
MKKITVMVALLVLVMISTIKSAKAQCKGESVFSASKSVYLDSADREARTVDENCTIRIDSTGITITPGDDAVMTGKVTTIECNWTIPFKDGKSIFKSTLSAPNGESRAATFVVEGKSGVVTLIATLDNDRNKRIKLVADKFSAK